MSYSEIQDIKRAAAKEWPRNVEKQIAMIRARCQVYSSRRTALIPNSPSSSSFDRIKQLIATLDATERNQLLDWLRIQCKQRNDTSEAI